MRLVKIALARSYHLDVDSNPEYIAACVIQLGTDFKGGYTEFIKKKSEKYYDCCSYYGKFYFRHCAIVRSITFKVKLS